MGATGGFVFAGARGRPISGLDAAMRAICAKLGVERATPHDLRRTHGSTITALGFGRDAMNRIQNHKEGGIATRLRRHDYAEENKRVMETVAAKIMALAEGGRTRKWCRSGVKDLSGRALSFIKWPRTPGRNDGQRESS